MRLTLEDAKKRFPDGPQPTPLEPPSLLARCALLVGVALAGFGGLFAFHAGRLGPTTFEETRNHGGFFPDGWSLP